jgi:hypothetical protein
VEWEGVTGERARPTPDGRPTRNDPTQRKVLEGLGCIATAGQQHRLESPVIADLAPPGISEDNLVPTFAGESRKGRVPTDDEQPATGLR